MRTIHISKPTLLYYMVALVAMLFTGCSDDFFGSSEQHDSNRIQLSGDIDQIAVTRVNDNGFCNGDVMGVHRRLRWQYSWNPEG